jgi:Mn2+/Fe2+ NRAMP family transporter
MSAPDRKARITQAVLVAAAIDAALIAGGAVGFLLTGQLFWIIGAVVIGAMAIMLALYQAGAFDTRDAGK